MENKIDQFFKERLQGHSLPPSEEAWASVEANLSKKNNVAVWRIAAAILITGALVSVIIWSQYDNKSNKQILTTKKSSKDNSIKENSSPQISSIEKKDQEKSNNKKSLNISPRLVSPQTESKSDQKESNENKMRSLKTPTAAEVVEVKEQTVAAAQENIQNEKINSKATSPTIIASSERKPIKLEFTLDGFSSEQPVATASEEKKSGLKKVWVMAREVKNGDGPVHEIKNELFALSFKKSKNQ